MSIKRVIVTTATISIVLFNISRDTIFNYFRGCSFSFDEITYLEWFIALFLTVLISITIYISKKSILSSIIYLYVFYIVYGFFAYAIRQYFENDIVHLFIFTTFSLLLSTILVSNELHAERT